MCIIAGFVIVFTAAAGMASIAYLDLFIGVLVTLTVVVAVPVLIHKAGGWHTIRTSLPPEHFQFLGNLTFAQAFQLLLPTMLLLIGLQGMYQKFFSAKTERDARLAVYGWIAGTIFLEIMLITLAVTASAILKTDRPRELLALAARNDLPPLLGAILIGGIFAKIVSTANNFLFSPATNLIHDVYERFINPQASERQVLIVSRVIVVLLGLFALLQATQFQSVLEASLYAYTVYGAAVTPSLLAIFFWRRTTHQGAITSIVLGTLITVAWKQIQHHAPGLLPLGGEVDAVYPALTLSIISLIGVSLMTRSPREEQLALNRERQNRSVHSA
jgi:SSS family solute:Na+ symporter/sodium/proline symporter